jgi:AraC-like DNA-binding protein
VGGALSSLLSMYLIFYPSKLYANKILGVLAFSWSVTVFGFVIQSPSFFSVYPHFYATLDVFALLFFPLIYVYIRTYLYVDARNIFKYIIHFLPSVLYLIVFIPFFIIDKETKIAMITNNGLPEWYHSMQSAFNLVIIAQGIFYTILSLRKLHHFQYFRKTRLSSFQLASLRLLRLFVIINMFLWTLGTSGAFIHLMNINLTIDLFRLFYLGLTILTLVLGAFTIQRPEFFSEEEDIIKYSFGQKEFTDNNERIVEVKKISDKELLINCIEKNKFYLKHDLKMQDLVEGTGLSYKRISEVLNNELKKSFFDMINEYRMQTAITLIKTGFHKKHTLLHLAEEAGFNSKTTFNRIFKKYTGQTPTEYIQSNKF